jgi:hypothetical protein
VVLSRLDIETDWLWIFFRPIASSSNFRQFQRADAPPQDSQVFLSLSSALCTAIQLPRCYPAVPVELTFFFFLLFCVCFSGSLVPQPKKRGGGGS